MDGFHWDEAKNAWLRENRGISFEEIVIRIEADGVVAVLEHPKPEYAGQLIAVLSIDGYAWAVPYRDTGQGVLLITAFPSRTLTKRYLRRGDHDEP